MDIGFLMAAFTERKQALHDMMASTLVTDRWAFTDHPERQNRQTSGCLVVLLVGVCLIVLLIAIFAAIAIPSYQDYLQRAQVSIAIAQAEPLQTQIVEAWEARSNTQPMAKLASATPTAILASSCNPSRSAA